MMLHGWHYPLFVVEYAVCLGEEFHVSSLDGGRFLNGRIQTWVCGAGGVRTPCAVNFRMRLGLKISGLSGTVLAIKQN